MSKTPTLASVNGTTLSGAQLKTFLTGIVAAFRTIGMQETDRATITSDTTLTVQNCGLVLVDCTGGNVALTLPTSGSTTDDAVYNIRRLDSTSNTLTVTRGGSDTVEGAATSISLGPQGVIALQMPAGGVDWKIYGRNGGTAAGARTELGAAASGAITASGLTLATSRLLGRTTASTGAVEELSAGSSLSLSGGSLNVADSGVTAAKLSGAQSGSAPIFAIRAWANFNGTGTVAIRASGNVSGVSDIGTGEYTVNFTTAMQDTNYSVMVTASDNAGGAGPYVVSGVMTKTTAGVSFAIKTIGGVLADAPNVDVWIIR